MEATHVSVLVQETIAFLQPRAGGRYLDGTLGGGGHAEQILIESSPDGQVLGLDWDDMALGMAQQRLVRFGSRLIARRASYAAAAEILAEIGWPSVHGAVLDLGVSSFQLESPERGFSFRSPARLDMRMDRRQSLDAYEIVNRYSNIQLERILRDYGEEPQARRLAKAIVGERTVKPIATTADLAQLVARIKGRGQRDHNPATQTFQALRIAVNRELQQLEEFLAQGYGLLEPSGRMAVISFHSLEDRLVKSAFRKWSRDCLCPPRTPACNCGWSQKTKLLTRRSVVASAEEMRANPRCRSARLRAVERI
jgi:16S rRNA (cytosine1402-N4)-methyltransferase